MIRTRTMFYVACDVAGCDSVCPNPDTDDVVAWSDEDSALAVADESEWTLKHRRHFCPEHFICQASGCHAVLGPLAGEQDYLCEKHAA